MRGPRRLRPAAHAGALVLALAVLVLPGAAQAAGTLDQQQSKENNGYSVAASQLPAQTFTAGRSGALTEVDLYSDSCWWPDGYPALRVAIEPLASNGAPSGIVLAEATAPSQCVTGWLAFEFSHPPVVQAGSHYAIMTKSDASLAPGPFWNLGFEDYDVFSGRGESNPYPGGSMWAWVMGWVWDEQPEDDVAFRTFVEPIPVATFLPPLTPSTSTTTVVNIAKNGRVVPVQVQLSEDGTPLSDGNAPGPVTLSVTDLGACGSGGSTDAVDTYAAGSSSSGNAFRYDANAGAWVYNLNTKALGLTSGHCYRLDVSVNGVPASNAWAILEPVR